MTNLTFVYPNQVAKEQDILDSWIKGQLSPATRKAYLRELNSFLKWLYSHSAGNTVFHVISILKNVSVKDIINYRNYLSEHKAPATVARAISSLKSLFKYLSALDIISKSPAGYVKLPKVSQESSTIALTQRDIETLIYAVETIKNPIKRERDRLILLLLFTNALRRAELTKIRLRDFQKDGEFDILKINAKGGKVETTKIKPIVKMCLNSYIQSLEENGIFLSNDSYLFRNVSNNGYKTGEKGGISTHAIYLLIKKYANIAGLPDKIVDKLHPHCARHSAITIVVDNAGIHKAVAYARHSDPKTTMRYYRRKKDLTVHGTDFINYEISLKNT